MIKFGNDIKKTLGELIDEEFTSRAFDSVKAQMQMVSIFAECGFI